MLASRSNWIANRPKPPSVAFSTLNSVVSTFFQLNFSMIIFLSIEQPASNMQQASHSEEGANQQNGPSEQEQAIFQPSHLRLKSCLIAKTSHRMQPIQA